MHTRTYTNIRISVFVINFTVCKRFVWKSNPTSVPTYLFISSEILYRKSNLQLLIIYALFITIISQRFDEKKKKKGDRKY